jgi:diaminobutyrate-2-oxoglutarate transaminase
LAGICREHDIRLIVDDIQSGCGRTGTFFSFEQAGIIPDFVCLSKAIGGYGLPMSIVLVKPEYDQFAPSEHNGTFRGNNLAFVTAAAALEAYWRDDRLTASVRRKEQIVRARLRHIAMTMPPLTIGDDELEKGLSIFEAAALAVADEHQETISDVA